MSSYRSIVVGTDGSTQSMATVEMAARLARDAHATLTLACAYEQWRGPVASWLAHDSYSASPVSAADEVLRIAAARARAQGLFDVCERSVAGAPVDCLWSVAANAEADLLVVGENDFRTPIGRWAGTFSSAVRRRAASDVLIVNGAPR